MDIKQHLSDEEWSELLKPTESASEHLAQCMPCRQEHDNLHNLVAALPRWARSAEEQPDIFWSRQRLAIQSGIGQLSAQRRSSRLVWVAALGLILLASLILRTGSVGIAPQRSQADPDHELLVAVEQALDGDVPEALRPASLLADEVKQTAQLNTNSRNSKERTTHEN